MVYYTYSDILPVGVVFYTMDKDNAGRKSCCRMK